jgi:hypothetical protein
MNREGASGDDDRDWHCQGDSLGVGRRVRQRKSVDIREARPVEFSWSVSEDRRRKQGWLRH